VHKKNIAPEQLVMSSLVPILDVIKAVFTWYIIIA